MHKIYQARLFLILAAGFFVIALALTLSCGLEVLKENYIPTATHGFIASFFFLGIALFRSPKFI
jgi:hypothetical protein